MPESWQCVSTEHRATRSPNQLPEWLLQCPIPALLQQESMTHKNLALEQANNGQYGPFSRPKEWESDLPQQVKEVVEVIEQEYFQLLIGTELSIPKLEAFYRANDEYKLGLCSTGAYIDHSVLPKPLACSEVMVAEGQNSLQNRRTPHLPEDTVDAPEIHDPSEFLEFSPADDMILYNTLQNCVVESPKSYITKKGSGRKASKTDNSAIKGIMRTPSLIRANQEFTPSSTELVTPSTKAVGWIDEVDEAVDLAYEPEIDPDLEGAAEVPARLTGDGRKRAYVPVRHTNYSFVQDHEWLCDPFKPTSHEPLVSHSTHMPTPSLPELNAVTSPVTAKCVGDIASVSHTKSKSSVALSTPSRASRNSFRQRVKDARLLELDADMEFRALANHPDIRAKASRSDIRAKASTWPNKDMPQRMPFQATSSKTGESSASLTVPTGKTHSLPAIRSTAYQPAKKDSFAMRRGDSVADSTMVQEPDPLEEDLKMIARHMDLRQPTNKEMFNPERAMTCEEFLKMEARRYEKIDREQDMQDRRDLILANMEIKGAQLEREEAAKKEVPAKKMSVTKRSFIPRKTSAAAAATSSEMTPGRKVSITSSKTKKGLFQRYKSDEGPVKKARSFSTSIPHH